MPTFFSSHGKVIRVAREGAGVQLFQVLVGDEGGNGQPIFAPNQAAILTQAAAVEQGNFQFMHTLGETIYVYIFGDRIGELRLSGLCFLNPCGLDTHNEAKDGFSHALQGYRTNRLAARPAPVTISIGANSTGPGIFHAFLTGATVEVLDAEKQLGQWAYRFNTFY